MVSVGAVQPSLWQVITDDPGCRTIAVQLAIDQEVVPARQFDAVDRELVGLPVALVVEAVEVERPGHCREHRIGKFAAAGQERAARPFAPRRHLACCAPMHEDAALPGQHEWNQVAGAGEACQPIGRSAGRDRGADDADHLGVAEHRGHRDQQRSIGPVEQHRLGPEGRPAALRFLEDVRNLVLVLLLRHARAVAAAVVVETGPDHAPVEADVGDGTQLAHGSKRAQQQVLEPLVVIGIDLVAAQDIRQETCLVGRRLQLRIDRLAELRERRTAEFIDQLAGGDEARYTEAARRSPPP